MRDLAAALLAFLGGLLAGWLLRCQHLLAAPRPVAPPPEPASPEPASPPPRAMRDVHYIKRRYPGKVPRELTITPRWEVGKPRLTEQQMWGLLEMPEHAGQAGWGVYIRAPSGAGMFMPLDSERWGPSHLVPAPSPYWSTNYVM